jgi:hypothetical protein
MAFSSRREAGGESSVLLTENSSESLSGISRKIVISHGHWGMEQMGSIRQTYKKPWRTVVRHDSASVYADDIIEDGLAYDIKRSFERMT